MLILHGRYRCAAGGEGDRTRPHACTTKCQQKYLLNLVILPVESNGLYKIAIRLLLITVTVDMKIVTARHCQSNHSIMAVFFSS